MSDPIDLEEAAARAAAMMMTGAMPPPPAPPPMVPLHELVGLRGADGLV
jgi:hypothetical protein